MDITVKCPNCYQQVSLKNRYCIFCGCDLEKAAPAAEAVEEPCVDETTPPAGAPGFDGPCYCPNGHDVPDPSLGFCMVCGSPLVNTPSPGGEKELEHEASEASGTTSRSARRCTCCGYLCYEPDLPFCPACGAPFDEETPTGGGTPDGAGDWLCPCGKTNKWDSAYCVLCGMPKGEAASEARVEPEHSKIYIPDGMKPPTDSDLEVKAKYGN